MTIAPVPIDFALAFGAAGREPEAYTTFWRELADACTDERLEFPHAVHVVEVPRYGSLRADALLRPLHLVAGTLAPDTLPIDVPTELADLWARVDTVEFRLYDHGVTVVELGAEVADWLGAGDTGPGERLDALQDGIIRLTGLAAGAVVQHVLQPLLDQARSRDPDGSILLWEDDTWHTTGPRWVSRSLVLDLDEPGTGELARHWLADVGDAPVDALLAQETDHVSTWLNYVHLGHRADVRTELAATTVENWRGMRYAQYFYAALDLVDDRLNGVLAQTTQGRRAWELAELTESLRTLSHRAELVMLDLQDLRKYVTRQVRTEMDGILDAWHYGHLVEEPVKFKISICDRRLAELATGAQSRAGTVTDIILLGIGVTSVLATALALTEFGRGVATDPDQAGFGSRSGLTEWFASQSADAILVGSLVVSALLVVLFWAVRRSGSS
ncbi:hypothetical protein ACQBAU_01870 [Propionibacteriaceae bacterium Y2011]